MTAATAATAAPTAGTTAPTGATTTGLVTFRLGERDYATPLAEVREVVRLSALAALPGMAPPLAGVVELRGAALPVLDLRPSGGGRGDVLVVERGGGEPVGVAVDRVRAVVRADELPPAGGADREVLPGYVVDVLRGADGVVFLVDLQAMVAASRAAADA